APSLLCYNDFIWPEEGKHWVSLNFKAKTVGGDMTIADKTEVKECAWFDYATVPTNISQFTKRCLEITKCQ
ncbi:MAG: hypothetical protein NTW50_05725, partial [Candidatus Berkelbacteria bacterium]|nr:hypothetical protein [Candidatus Berkelbacteria bacterium]